MNDAMPTMDAMIGTADCDPFDFDGVRYYLRRHALTNIHRNAWKAAGQVQRAMQRKAEGDLALIARMDAALASGTLKRRDYEKARQKMDKDIRLGLAMAAPALDALLDLHLVALHALPAHPNPALLLCNPTTRRKILLSDKLEVIDEIRRRLIEDFGPQQAARDFGLWGSDVAPT
jgi:hypothetical protein